MHGLATGNAQFKLLERSLYGSSRLGLEMLNTDYSNLPTMYKETDAMGSSYTNNYLSGLKAYEFSNYLGNVLTTFSDRKLPVDANSDNLVDFNVADVLSANDYYAFGAPMPGRQFNSGNYRYSMNGKEKDDETELLNYGFRMYDARLGRFISTDPVGRQFPFYSPYQYAGNSPIWATDLDGLERNYTNAVDPVPSEKPLYGRRSELDAHTESLPVGTKGTDWQTTTQMNFYFSEGNYKWVISAGVVFYFEQMTLVCKVQNYKTILVEQNVVTPEKKAEYKVIRKHTKGWPHGGLIGASVSASDLAKGAANMVSWDLEEVRADGGTPNSVTFTVRDITDPNINAIKAGIEKAHGLPVNVTEDKSMTSAYRYQINYSKSVMVKPGTPAYTTTTQTEQTVPAGESYVPCPPESGGTSEETTEEPPH